MATWRDGSVSLETGEVSIGVVKLEDTDGTDINPAREDGKLSTISNRLSILGGFELTFETPVVIDQTAEDGPPYVTNLSSAEAGKVKRLHALYGFMEAQGTLTIEDTDGTDLTGPMPIAATGGMNLGWVAQARGAHAVSSTGKGLQIRTTEKFYGRAICSSE